MKTAEQIIRSIERRYAEGFTKTEIDFLLNNNPEVNVEKFNDALMCSTGVLVNYRKPNETSVVYEGGVLTALRCGLENRDMKQSEWG